MEVIRHVSSSLLCILQVKDIGRKKREKIKVGNWITSFPTEDSVEERTAIQIVFIFSYDGGMIAWSPAADSEGKQSSILRQSAYSLLTFYFPLESDETTIYMIQPS